MKEVRTRCKFGYTETQRSNGTLPQEVKIFTSTKIKTPGNDHLLQYPEGGIVDIAVVQGTTSAPTRLTARVDAPVPSVDHHANIFWKIPL